MITWPPVKTFQHSNTPYPDQYFTANPYPGNHLENWPKISVMHTEYSPVIHVSQTEEVSHKLISPKLPHMFRKILHSILTVEWMNWNFLLELTGLHVVALPKLSLA